MSNIHGFHTINNNRRPYNSLDVQQPRQNRSSSSSAFRFGTNENGQQMTCLEAFFPGFKVKSFTFIVTIIQIIIYVIEELYSYLLKDGEGGQYAFSCVLYKFGAQFTPSIVIYYQFQRLFLPIFLHGGFKHILFNMISQWFYSYRLEANYGTKKFALLYLLAGVGGNILSAAYMTQSISVGASSSLFGVFAFFIAFLLTDPKQLGDRKCFQLIFLIIMLLSNIVNANANSNVDNSAHLGGFITGALIAINIVDRDSDPKWALKQKAAIGVLVIGAVGLMVYVMNLGGDMRQRATEIENLCHAVVGW